MSLLEQNARILETLEADWSELGNWRQIDFRVRFTGWDPWRDTAELARAQAVRFTELARAEGCEVSTSTDQTGNDQYITATKLMEPTAANITQLEERLKSFADEQDGYWEGWNYPPKKHVTFYPACPRSNAEAQHDRAAVLLGSDLVADPFKERRYQPIIGSASWTPSTQPTNYFSTPSPPPTENFKLVPSEFLRRAQAFAPSNPKPAASAFAQWVYSLYASAYGRDEDRE